MYVVVGSYSKQGASALFDVMSQREEGVKALVRGCLGSSAMRPFVAAATVNRDCLPGQGRHG